MLIGKVKENFNVDCDKQLASTHLISFLNPYSYLVMRKEKDIYMGIDSFYCDGILFAKAMQLTGKKYTRVSFDMTSIAPTVFHDAEKKGALVYFVGSEPGVVEKAASYFYELYPNLKLAGLRHGFFDSSSERQAFLQELKLLSPDIVIVGMGAPAQEKFIVDLKNTGWEGVAYTCGGFLHQTASSGTNYYPRWIDKFNLRWLYRMYDEPKLVKRYFVYYPLFVVMFTYDIVVFKFNKRQR
ncbi:MAG: glycosyltransferase [Halomonas sp.]|nr:WecB/TagA/CpsF family glycosyltransferase [Halomonas sp.]TVP44945.1 MAG: glycosyltransferase [Halomonas sp.]